jgi:hypothetical protein
MGNYVIEVRKSVIVNPSQLGNYKIADIDDLGPLRRADVISIQRRRVLP